MIHRRRLMALVILSGALHGCGAVVVRGARQLYAALNATETEVGAALGDFGRHLQARNHAALELLLAPDALWGDPSGQTRPIVGREDILRMLKACPPGPSSRLELTPTQTGRLGERVTQRGMIRQTEIGPDEAQRLHEGRFEAEWARSEQGRWHLLRWTPSMPPDAPVCDTLAP